MTTYEELDLADAFGEFDWTEPTRSRRPRVLAAVVFVLAAALIVVGVLWAQGNRGVDAPAALEPAVAVPALARAQSAGDRVDPAGIEALDVLPASTRLLTTTAVGTHYAALDSAGGVCVLTTRVGDLPTADCAPATESLAIMVSDEAGSPVLMLTAATDSPGEEWAPAAPHVFVRR